MGIIDSLKLNIYSNKYTYWWPWWAQQENRRNFDIKWHNMKTLKFYHFEGEKSRVSCSENFQLTFSIFHFFFFFFLRLKVSNLWKGFEHVGLRNIPSMKQKWRKIKLSLTEARTLGIHLIFSPLWISISNDLFHTRVSLGLTISRKAAKIFSRTAYKLTNFNRKSFKMLFVNYFSL